MGETRREMKQSESLQASLPEDIALKIASFLPVGDLCALGSCSRFWREFCGSDVLWESLTRQRWPSLNFSTESSSVDHGDSSSLEGWRDFYVKRHTEMAERAMSVVQHVEQCLFSDSLEIRDYLKAIELLNSMRLGFKDVEMFLFRAEVNVLLNLVGLHYCMHWLEVPKFCRLSMSWKLFEIARSHNVKCVSNGGISADYYSMASECVMSPIVV
ncbi:uncharacterized protein LOC115753670 isoform X10 [Rhodamnia argentea]|uniref:Uncharacterized protein LOC115753670 isoform X10 n=1 Tax=Rhodamnia argentea TaxID=178133 RepID=A0ABM3HTR9_9MYRT|nr:uncharacterized protein LOC115753670 isoform X10 [Rhodamnia argentea]XP_048139996.1 uncharacterized protein LOC115753670 isoform X10 [Rhodamnia argentea]